MSTLEGRVAIVTGGNSGIGKETAADLASMGAHVIVATRNPTKAAAAVQEIMGRTPTASVEHLPLDLASFASVHTFADAFNSRFDRLDVLVNNAGLTLRKRTVTEDGHETQFQVNHLSHFLLTALVHDRLAAAPAARVVNVSSTGHTFARNGLDFDDLDWERRKYRGFMVYCATKLANVLFTRELARREDGATITANAVHPGWVGSNFGREGDMGPLIGAAMLAGRPFAISSSGRGPYLGVSGELSRCGGHHRPVLLQVPGGGALGGGTRQRRRRATMGCERRADRRRLSSDLGVKDETPRPRDRRPCPRHRPRGLLPQFARARFGRRTPRLAQAPDCFRGASARAVQLPRLGRGAEGHLVVPRVPRPADRGVRAGARNGRAGAAHGRQPGAHVAAHVRQDREGKESHARGSRSTRRARGRRTSAASASRPTARRAAKTGIDRVIPAFGPQIVFLANRHYDAPGNVLPMAVNGKNISASDPLAVQTIKQFTTRSLVLLRRPGRELVILEPTPLPESINYDPMLCVATGSTQCSFSVSPHATALTMVDRDLAGAPDVWSVDLDRLACPRFPVCDSIVDGMIVRRDHTHLTATYTHAVAGPLATILREQHILR